MKIYKLYSYKYNINISKVAKRRFDIMKLEYEIISESETFIEIGTEDTEKLAASVCEMILYDISQFELADMINELPFDIEERRAVLTGSCGYARRAALRLPVKNALYEYFKENSSLVIEGFIMFRMRDTTEIWERCIEKATEDNILLSQQLELAQLFGELIGLYPTGTNDITVTIRRDGTFAVVDNEGSHIDYPENSADNVLGMLISAAPDTVTVYDMGNKNDEFIKSVRDIFGQRLKVFRS